MSEWGYRLWRNRFGRCTHRSHRLRLWCWRPWSYQSQCYKHNRECFSVCPSWLH